MIWKIAIGKSKLTKSKLESRNRKEQADKSKIESRNRKDQTSKN